MEYEYQAKVEYPKIDIKIKSINETRLLMPVYGGKDSETSAIFEYIYQHYVLGQTQDEVAEIFMKIAIVEMKHHEMLGEMIVQLGGKPIIADNYRYWQGSYLNYTNSLCSMINFNIASEYKAIADYEYVVKHSTCETVKKVVERIILDEKVHIETLEKLKAQYC